MKKKDKNKTAQHSSISAKSFSSDKHRFIGDPQFNWGMEYWEIQDILDSGDVQIRYDKVGDLAPYRIRRIENSQCKVACPVDQNVKAYIGLIATGKFEKALEVIKENNPFPAICGRICMHPCEAECARGEFDKSIAIHSLKRFVADYELKLRKEKKGKFIPSGARIKRKSISPNAMKVAIIGSGPAGLTAAADLARSGFRVTVFEALPVLGGMLRVGIPDYRLPKKIINAEIELLLESGIEVKTNTKIGKDIEISDLPKMGFKAVFIATGAHKSLKLGILGEDDYKGVLDNLQFLRDVNLGSKKKPGKSVIVIGGGYSAFDTARTAIRLGCDEVHIIYSRTVNEIPIAEQEIYEAKREGITIHYLTIPVKVLGQKGHVNGLECVDVKLDEPDIAGRRQPIPIVDSNFVIPTDVIIPAIGQEPDLSWLPEDYKFEISRWNCFTVNPDSLATNIPGFFAGGDAVSGPKSVIEAISTGHRAAKSIHKFLKGKDIELFNNDIEIKESELIIKDFVPSEKERVQMVTLSPEKRRNNFKEVEVLPTEEQVREEAKRCLMCGPCSECKVCIKECSKKLVAISTDKTIGKEELVRIPWKPELFPSTEKSWEAVIDIPEKTTARLDLSLRLITQPSPDSLETQFLERDIPVVVEPITSFVTEELCRGCGLCNEACEYSAITIEEKNSFTKTDNSTKRSSDYQNFIAHVDQSLCKGCGACGAVCPTGAMEVNHFTNLRINEIVKEVLK